MASGATAELDEQPRHRPPPPAQDPSDGRGAESIGTPDRSIPRYIYYRLYTKDGPLTSNHPVYANNPFISRTLPKLITPPRTALFVKRHLCKIEGLSKVVTSKLFQSLSSQAEVVESFQLSVREHSGAWLSKDDPIALVVELEETEKLSASTAQVEGLPEAGPPELRYIYYRLYDEDGAMDSKTSFDVDDPSLGRIDTTYIAPPQTVTSLRVQVMKAEGFIKQKVLLSDGVDGEVPMNDNDHIPLQAQTYPGCSEDEPITVICTQEGSTHAMSRQIATNSPITAPVTVTSGRIPSRLFCEDHPTELATHVKIHGFTGRYPKCQGCYDVFGTSEYEPLASVDLDELPLHLFS